MALSCVGGVVLGPVASELSKLILDVIGKVVHCKDNLEELNSTLEELSPRIGELERLGGEIEKLDGKRDRLSEEQRNLQRNHVKKLMERLETGKELASKCSNISSCNLLKRYSYSKKFLNWDKSMDKFFKQDMLMEILGDTKRLLVDLNKRLNELSLRDIAGGNGTRIWSEGSCAVPKIPDFTVGLEIPLRELKKVLLRDGVRVLGLYGLGGCGKTTLAKMLCHDQEVKAEFQDIFFLTISSTPNLKVILQNLVEEMVGDRVSEFVNDENAINRLGYVLKKKQEESKPVLIVLDDVWQETIVQKLAVFETKGYKMLITSRTEFQIGSKYSLRRLSDQDAITLFHQLTYTQGGSENYVPSEDDLDKIVRGCKGFPLLLEVLANSLHGQPEIMWKNTEWELSQGSIIDSHEDLLNRLATSLQFLEKNKVQECFLDLGCFLEDQRIPASALIDIWVELYKLNENIARGNLLTLSNRNLVNLIDSTRKEAGDPDSDLNKLIVVQHDMLRELAIHKNQQERKRLIFIKDKEGLCERWKEESHEYLGARLASIHTGEMCLTSCRDMELPEVEVLILNFSAMEYTLPPFMKKMGKLKVLIITNHGRNYANNKDFSTCSYLSNLKRLRLERVSIPSLNEIMIQLANLQKISLIMCEIGQALRNCTVNFPHILPNLKEINIDYCNDLVELPPGICDIVHLQKLSITNCHKLSALPQGIGDMTELEALRLHACTGLLELPDSIRKLKKLSFLDISDCLSIEKLPEGMGELHGLRKLDMRQCSGLKGLPDSVTSLGHLKDVICDEETARLWEFSKRNVQVRKEDINLNWLHR